MPTEALSPTTIAAERVSRPAAGDRQTLVQLDDAPVKMAFDGQHLYAACRHQLVKVPKDGGDATVLLERFLRVYSLVVDGDYLYVADDIEHVILRIRLDGSSQQVVTPMQRTPTGLQIDSSHLYWLVHHPSPQTRAVHRMSKQGGEVELLALVQPNGSLVGADDASLYVFVAPNRDENLPKHLATLSKNGSPLRPISLGDVLPNSRVHVGEHSLHFSDGRALYVAPRDGGSPRKLATARNLDQIEPDGDLVYYAVPSDGIYVVPSAGGAARQLAKTRWTHGLATDQEYLYYADGERQALRRMLKPAP